MKDQISVLWAYAPLSTHITPLYKGGNKPEANRKVNLQDSLLSLNM